MSYELKKPFSEDEKINFIVQHNRKNCLKIEETDLFLFALEPNEMMGEKEIEIEIPDYETVIEEYQEPVYKFVEMFDEDGNSLGFVEELDYYETKTKEEVVQVGTHIETMVVAYPVINPDYDAEQLAKEQEKIAMLSLTAADVERGIYKATGKDFDDVVALVTELQPQGLDIKALKIELKANNFYRGNPYVDAVGSLLGFTKEQLDEFFKTNDYIHLLSESEILSEDGGFDEAY